MRRFVAFFLAVIVSVMAFPIRALAVSENDLFMRYPYYLKNSEYDALEDKSFSICTRVLDSQSSFGKYAEIVTATLADDWLSIGLREIASKKFGWGVSYAESIRENSILKLLAGIASENSSGNEFSTKVANKVSTWMDVYSEFKDGFEKDEQLQSFLNRVLEKMGVQGNSSSVKAVLIKKIPGLLTSDVVQQSLDAYQTVMCIIALYGYRLESVRILMSAIDSRSDLYKGLDATLKKMLDNPAQYIDDYYTSKAILNAVGKWLTDVGKNLLQKALNKAVDELGDVVVSWMWIFSLSKTLYFIFIYEGYKANDYAEAVYLFAYMQDISNARSKLMIRFINGDASTGDIETYKNLVEISNLAQIATLYAFADLLNVYNNYSLKIEAEEQAGVLEWDRGYDWYLRQCTRALNSALKNGNAIEGTIKSRQQNQDDTNSQSPLSYELPIISEIVAPSGTLLYGQSFGLRGIISSPSVITNVSAHIYNSSGVDAISPYSTNPNSVSYDIRSGGLNDAMVFNRLPTGSYRYVVSATNAAGAKELINISFNIGNPSPQISVSRYEDCYVLIKCPVGYEVNLYKSPTDTSRFTYFSRGQEATSRRKAIMSDNSLCYEVGANHNGTDMKLWLKYESRLVITNLAAPQTQPTLLPPEPTEDTASGWSAWSDSFASPSETLEVETRQVVDLEGHTEYRYGRWTGPSIIWCKEYGQSLHGGSYSIEYSEWSTYRAYDTGTSWLCGHFDSEHSSHIGSIGLDSCGYPMWRKYTVNGYSNPDFFWEETRWINTTYKTQYRTRQIKVDKYFPVWLDVRGGTMNYTGAEYNGEFWDECIIVRDGSSYGDLPTPTKEGYTFDGWYSEPDGGELIVSTSTFIATFGEFSDYVLFARWTPLPPKVYTVTFNPNGGYVEPLSINVTEKESYGTLPTPTRSGYTFDGWYTTETGGTMVTNWSTVFQSQTLHAHWKKEEPKVFNVKLDPNGGVSEFTFKSVTTGETYKVFPVPIRSGYKFKGWFTSPNGGVQITADDIVNLTPPQTLYAHWEKAVLQFEDVPTEAYFYNSVMWAVENGITNGTTSVTFSPYTTCSTAHIITFLWRAFDSPEPSISNPFTNLNTESYFAKAAIWGHEKGLLVGDFFNSGMPCTRSSTVVYLWKLAGKPFVKLNMFSDVPEDAEYANAVSWAVNQGITNGTTETTFSPNQICTRAQIATFLWRDLAQ